MQYSSYKLLLLREENMTNRSINGSRNYVNLLWILTALFCFRVLAQPLSLIIDVPWLPPFEEWHSNAMPYILLLTFQIIIITMMVYTNISHYKKKKIQKRKFGKALLIVALLYVIAMIIRLILGATMIEPSSWFANKISPWFHLVLAAYLLVIARFHLFKNYKGEK